MKVELEEPELEGGMSREEYAGLWAYARLRTQDQMLGLLCWAEQISRLQDPLDAFTQSQLMWLDYAKQNIGHEWDEEPDEPEEPRQVH